LRRSVSASRSPVFALVGLLSKALQELWHFITHIVTASEADIILAVLSLIDLTLWLPVAGICVCGLTAHYCLTNAFRHGDAIVVIPIDFLRVPMIGLIGWLVYAEQPELAVLIGAAIVISGVLINIYAESRARM